MRPLRAIFAAPALLAVLTGVGLMSALLGDDIWDALSWGMLSVPIAVFATYFALAVRRRGRNANE
jgi:hypothetical protein